MNRRCATSILRAGHSSALSPASASSRLTRHTAAQFHGRCATRLPGPYKRYTHSTSSANWTTPASCQRYDNSTFSANSTKRYSHSTASDNTATQQQPTDKDSSRHVSRPRRALLFVPGDNKRMIESASRKRVDTVVMDLEAAVAADNKWLARNTVVDSLKELDFGESEVLVRINQRSAPAPASRQSESSDQEQYDATYHDLASIIRPEGRLPDGIILPKMESQDDVEFLVSRIREFAGTRERAESVSLLGIVESAKGVTRLADITENSTGRLEALICGAEDYAADLGIERTKSNKEVLFMRNMVLVHCKAASLQAIDIVHTQLDKAESIVEEADEGAAMGFSGKAIIHPSHIDFVQAAFSPSEKAVERARRIVEASRAHGDSGKGAFKLDGQMIDLPIIKNAEAVLSKADAAAKSTTG